MKRLISLMMLLCLLPAPAPAEGAAKLETRSVPVYCAGRNDYRSAADMLLMPAFTLYYADGVDDLPYADVREFMKLVNLVDAFEDRDIYGGEPIGTGTDYTAALDEEKAVFTCAYEPRGSELVIDFGAGTAAYTCMDTFGKSPEFAPFELQTNQLDFLERIYDMRQNRLGTARTISLKDYGIPMLVRDGKYLLPLHTAFDLMIWVPHAPGKIMCCNGAAMFISDGDSMFGFTDDLTELGEIYFAEKPRARSPELAEYGYNELCLMLDHFYGLKNAHHITDFRGFFRNNGYEEKLKDADTVTADQALLDIIQFALNDFHSNYYYPSWMSGTEEKLSYDGTGFSSAVEERKNAAFEAATTNNWPEIYQECGNTAYLFLRRMYTVIDSEQFYAFDATDKDNLYMDVVAMILYADKMINRENSPIENVVLDLSMNPGGDVNSPACVLSWFLGEGYMTIANSFTGGLGVGRYRADINRDREFTDEDSLRGRKKLFCLISPLTFSSANLTAAMLKMSGEVTLIGQTTRGGSGIVTPAVTGWDSVFSMSGFWTVVTVKNGSWYDADTGVTPDVYIADPATYYDREKLTEIVNSIW